MTSTAGLRQAGAKKWAIPVRSGCWSSPKSREAGMRAGVGADDRFGGNPLLDHREDLLLERDVLGGRLDHQVGGGEGVVVRAGDDAFQHRRRLLLLHLAALHRLLGVALVAGQKRVQGLPAHVHHGEGEPRDGRLEVVADVRSDGAGAHDGHVPGQVSAGRPQEGVLEPGVELGAVHCQPTFTTSEAPVSPAAHPVKRP